MGGVSYCKSGLLETFSIVTDPTGVPSIRSNSLFSFMVMRREDPGEREIFLSDRINAVAEREDFGRLIKMVFLPDELNP